MSTTLMTIIITLLTPVAWILIRIATGLVGWMFFMYLLGGIVLALIVGAIVVMAFTAAKESDLSKAKKYYFASIAAHLLSALSFNDFGDAPNSEKYSIIGQVFGQAAGEIVGLVLLLAWLVLTGLAVSAALRARKADADEWRRTRNPDLL